MGWEGFRIDTEGNTQDIRRERDKAEKLQKETIEEAKKPAWVKSLEKTTGKKMERPKRGT